MTRPFGGPGYALVERILKTIERRRLLASGDVVVVAVSGGPDSVCLLDVVARIASRLELTLHVAHVNHGLSEESEAVASRVATATARAGFDAHVVRAPDLEGPNLHARARSFRYGFFDMIAAQNDASRIATGHTLDDRVETTLARLAHGAPPAGLAGIRYADGNRIHPLLDVRRAETRRYCEEVGLEFHDDPSNTDLRFERAAVRTTLVAPLEERWGDGGVRAVAAAAQRLAEDADALDGIGERLSADLAQRDARGTTFARAAFDALPRALARRLLEAAVGRIRDRRGGGAPPGTRIAVAGGAEIVVEGEEIRVTGGGPGDADGAEE
jgi:tRNA(Ile)-lysidine synthase